jgi:hypothetical protein
MDKPKYIEIREKKLEKIKQSQDIKTLTQDARFQFLMNKIADRIKSSEEEIKTSKSWEDFLTKKAYYEGLKALRIEIDTIISKGETTERSLKS